MLGFARHFCLFSCLWYALRGCRLMAHLFFVASLYSCQKCVKGEYICWWQARENSCLLAAIQRWWQFGGECLPYLHFALRDETPSTDRSVASTSHLAWGGMTMYDQSCHRRKDSFNALNRDGRWPVFIWLEAAWKYFYVFLVNKLECCSTLAPQLSDAAWKWLTLLEEGSTGREAQS